MLYIYIICIYISKNVIKLWESISYHIYIYMVYTHDTYYQARSSNLTLAGSKFPTMNVDVLL